MKELLTLPHRDYTLEKELGIIPAFRSFYGIFDIPTSTNICHVIASSHMGWEHISISLPDRCPNFSEMVEVKDFFFNPGEIAFQIHPSQENYVNFHERCLHIWRPSNTNVPVPDIKSVINRYEFIGNTSKYKHGKKGNDEFAVIYEPGILDWETICKIKHEIFGDEPALQYHISKDLDLNNKKIYVLWKHRNNFNLPVKELVY